ncbi:MAG: hypothetical protein EO766_12165 [Hydrotalea sp. AMD]|uniref:hypothetical protein n=1 Tax=Hydrotalea sp. AMD TaxID=2501297 RepID=UPI001024BA4A|nr:hypothetical protein [Hydrotalea sp. AMD]RWZ87272.1 MAG: hypothetical protein EO766_12165 [Hydrotalea sp. AMD]
MSKLIIFVLLSTTVIGCGDYLDKLQAENDIKQADLIFQEERRFNDELHAINELRNCSMTIIKGVKIVRCPLSSVSVEYGCGKGCVQRATTIEQ